MAAEPAAEPQRAGSSALWGKVPINKVGAAMIQQVGNAHAAAYVRVGLVEADFPTQGDDGRTFAGVACTGPVEAGELLLRVPLECCCRPISAEPAGTEPAAGHSAAAAEAADALLASSAEAASALAAANSRFAAAVSEAAFSSAFLARSSDARRSETSVSSFAVHASLASFAPASAAAALLAALLARRSCGYAARRSRPDLRRNGG